MHGNRVKGYFVNEKKNSFDSGYLLPHYLDFFLMYVFFLLFIFMLSEGPHRLLAVLI